MPLEDIKEKTEDLASHVEDLANTFYRLTIINATQKIVNVSSVTIVGLAVCSMGMLVLLFVGLALSWWLGDLLQSRAAGFLLVGVLFMIIAGLIYYYRKRMVFPFIRNRIIRKLYE